MSTYFMRDDSPRTTLAAWLATAVVALAVYVPCVSAADSGVEHGDPPPTNNSDIRSEITSMVGQLDAGSLQSRTDLTNAMVSRDDFDINAVYLLMAGEEGIQDGQSITFEQRDRLMRILERRQLEYPGVIGITMDERSGPLSVGIRSVVPDAPSARVLRPGDQILEINGQPLQALGESDPSAALQFAVAARRAGDPLTMLIERNGVEIEVTTRLADSQKLTEFGSTRLQAKRQDIWNVVSASVSPTPIPIPLMDEYGELITEVVQSEQSTFDGNQRRMGTRSSQQVARRTLERNFTNHLRQLLASELDARRLAEIVSDIPSLHQSLIKQADELQARTESVQSELQAFRRSFESGGSTNEASAQPNRQSDG